METMQLADAQVRQETRNYFANVFRWMGFGLLLSAASAFCVASVPALFDIFVGNPISLIVLVVAQLVLVWKLSRSAMTLSPSAAQAMFVAYCFLTGLTLSTVLLAYTLTSAFITFLVTAGMFGVMSLYGYRTKRDLSPWGHFLMMALFGLIIAMAVNLFVLSDTADLWLSGLGVIVFAGLTAYDMQKLRKFNIIGNEGSDDDKKEAIVGALILYLDFINLFLDLLRFTGNRRK